jgi:hypothetical protein
MELTSYKEYILEKVTIYDMILESKIVFKNFLGILSKMEVMKSQRTSKIATTKISMVYNITISILQMKKTRSVLIQIEKLHRTSPKDYVENG